MSLIIQNGNRNDLNAQVLKYLPQGQIGLVCPFGSVKRNEYEPEVADSDPAGQVDRIIEFHLQNENNSKISDISGIVLIDDELQREVAEEHIELLRSSFGKEIENVLENIEIVSDKDQGIIHNKVDNATFTYIGGGCPFLLKAKMDEVNGLQEHLLYKAKTSTVTVYSAGMVGYLEKFVAHSIYEDDFDVVNSEGPLGIAFLPHAEKGGKQRVQEVLRNINQNVTTPAVALQGDLLMAVDLNTGEVTNYEPLSLNSGVSFLGLDLVQNPEVIKQFLNYGLNK